MLFCASWLNSFQFVIKSSGAHRTREQAMPSGIEPKLSDLLSSIPFRAHVSGWCGCLPAGLAGAVVIGTGIWRAATAESGNFFWHLGSAFLAAIIISTGVKFAVLTARAMLLRLLPHGAAIPSPSASH